MEMILSWGILPVDQEYRTNISHRWALFQPETFLQFSIFITIFGTFLYVDPEDLFVYRVVLSIIYLKNTKFPLSIFIYPRMLQIPVTRRDIVSSFICHLKLTETCFGIFCHSTKSGQIFHIVSLT